MIIIKIIKRTDGSTAHRRDRLFDTARQLDARAFGVDVVRDDGGVVARRARKASAVAHDLLDVAHDGTFGQLSHWQHVADGEVSAHTAVDELARVRAFRRNKRLFHSFVFI